MIVMNNLNTYSKDLHKLKEFSSENSASERSIELSEEMDSQKSVVKVKKWPSKNVDVRLHIQILRIREEDSYLGYDNVVNLSSKDNKIIHGGDDQLASSNVGVVVFPRQILPASPLGAGVVH